MERTRQVDEREQGAVERVPHGDREPTTSSNDEAPQLTSQLDDDEVEEDNINPSSIDSEVLSSWEPSSCVNDSGLNILTVAKKREIYHYEEPTKKGFREAVSHSLKKKTTCSRKRARDALYLRLPILDWLLHYKVNQDLFNDVISGITVAVMHIPQGMAYAMLANLDPIVGIYMAFFPVLVYSTFTSSRHCSIGTFAVVCIMTGKVVVELSTLQMDDSSTLSPINLSIMSASNDTDTPEYSPVQVASILSFAVGVWMLIFGILQLGSLCVFLSDMLVSGFTTGAAIHVLTSQVPKLFGIQIPSQQGVLKIPKLWYSIFANIMYSNPATMVISLVSFIILILNNEFFKPQLRKITSIPFPIELVVVIGGTLVSSYGELNTHFNVEIVGEIPTGLPEAQSPPMNLIGQVVVPSLIIAIVSFTVSYSMAKIFSKKRDYLVDATQELYSLGLSNMVGSLFSCGPIAASLSRSLIQESVGGATQLASYISCAILILVLLFIGPFFESLPNSVLASIIAVALKGMFLQVGDVSRMWRISRIEALLWLTTFLGVVLLDIDYGLFVGICVALLLLLVRNQAPIVMVLGQVPRTDLYLDKTRYSTVVEHTGIKICQVMGNLHFANQDLFRQTLIKAAELEPRMIMKWKRKREKLKKKNLKAQGLTPGETSDIFMVKKNPPNARGNEQTLSIDTQVRNLKNSFQNCSSIEQMEMGSINLNVPEDITLIVDFSGVSQIDISAARNLVQVLKEYGTAGIVVLYTALSDPALEVMSQCGCTKDLSEELFFHSIPDAVAFVSNLTKKQPLPLNPSARADVTAHL